MILFDHLFYTSNLFGLDCLPDLNVYDSMTYTGGSACAMLPCHFQESNACLVILGAYLRKFEWCPINNHMIFMYK